jgi:hypothetical protein
MFLPNFFFWPSRFWWDYQVCFYLGQSAVNFFSCIQSAFLLKFQVSGIYNGFAGVFGHFWDDFNEITGPDDHLDISSFQVFFVSRQAIRA